MSPYEEYEALCAHDRKITLCFWAMRRLLNQEKWDWVTGDFREGNEKLNAMQREAIWSHERKISDMACKLAIQSPGGEPPIQSVTSYLWERGYYQ